MNAGIIKKIIALAAITSVCGCSSVATRYAQDAGQPPILSAEQTASMIKVTVTTVAPAENQESIVAANIVD